MPVVSEVPTVSKVSEVPTVPTIIANVSKCDQVGPFSHFVRRNGIRQSGNAPFTMCSYSTKSFTMSSSDLVATGI